MPHAIVRKDQRTACSLTEEEFNSLEVILEQVKSLADLIAPEYHDVEHAGTLTCLNVIMEKCDEASRILHEADARGTQGGEHG
jgi:hypothetical protein